MKKYVITIFLFHFVCVSQDIIQEIELENGWSLFSTYIEPNDNSIEAVFSDIIDNIIIIKDENGNVYWPEYELNSIQNLNIGEGYQIKTNNPITLIIRGNQTNCTTDINLDNGWNLIGCLILETSNIETEFESIVDEIIVIKDDQGNIYWPMFNINTIQSIEPGK